MRRIILGAGLVVSLMSLGAWILGSSLWSPFLISSIAITYVDLLLQGKDYE